jgi:hypothetical protein
MSPERRPAAGQGGYIYVSDEPRHGELIADEASFTAIVSSQPRITARQPAFLTLDRARVDAVARMSQAGPAASFKARVRFDETHQLMGEIGWGDVLDRLSTATRAEIEAVLERGGGQLAERAFAELVDTLQRLCPDSGGDIDLVLMLSLERAALPRATEGEPITMFEGDAVALALDMAGFNRRDELAYWTGDAHAPFLAGVSSFSLLEDRMIDNDAHVFGDWELIAANAVGWAEFERDGDHLWTINVNRSPVERSLGVDLIYYTHVFNAYVLVQYKRMERESGRDAVFRPSDTFEEELARMRALVLDDAEPSAPADFRLDARCCYLKLCPAVAKEVPVGSLVGGMYIPLAYWDLLAGSADVLGPRGGVAVTHENAGRYFDNTQFVSLVQDAWIGSRGVTSDQITEIVRSGLDADRSVILAAGKRADAGRRRRRRRR